jgi:hypothetical protein
MTATLIAQINVSLDGYIENDDHEITDPAPESSPPDASSSSRREQ